LQAKVAYSSIMIEISDYIRDREIFGAKFGGLQIDRLPLWGKMKPQQMVAHLADEIKWSNGKSPCCCIVSEEQAVRNKEIMIYSDILIPKNFYIGELPPHYLTMDLGNAIRQLMDQLHRFDLHFQDEGQTEMHPRFGPLAKTEWLIWQQKHFSHHLMQFALIPETKESLVNQDLMDCG
jgi:hypothetical protein